MHFLFIKSFWIKTKFFLFDFYVLFFLYLMHYYICILGYPIIGNLLDFLKDENQKDVSQFYKAIIDKHGPVYRLR